MSTSTSINRYVVAYSPGKFWFTWVDSKGEQLFDRITAEKWACYLQSMYKVHILPTTHKCVKRTQYYVRVIC